LPSELYWEPYGVLATYFLLFVVVAGNKQQVAKRSTHGSSKHQHVCISSLAENSSAAAILPVQKHKIKLKATNKACDASTVRSTTAHISDSRGPALVPDVHMNCLLEQLKVHMKISMPRDMGAATGFHWVAERSRLRDFRRSRSHIICHQVVESSGHSFTQF